MKQNKTNKSSTITYYDSVSGVIRIGNDQPQCNGVPCASPLELTDEMKAKIREKKAEKANYKYK